MSTGFGANLKYIVGIIAVIGLGAFTWWMRPYVVPQLSVFLFIVLEYAAVILVLSGLKFRIKTNLRYLVGIIVLTGLGVFVWWTQQYVLQQMVGVQQVGAFLYCMIGYAAVILVLSGLKFRIKTNIKTNLRYLVGIIGLTGLGAIAWYAQEYVAPQLGVFFGFITAYAAAVFVLFYILGRSGG
jgi:hypothetical protein